MTKKELLRSIAFVLVVCMMLLLLCEVFELDDTTYIPTRFKTFYDLNENTLDAVWIGTSGVDRYWVSSKAYEEHGMTVFTLSSDAMPTWLFTYVVDEIYKTQNPEVLIVDIRAFCQTNTVESKDVRARRLLDAMDPFSINKIRAAFRTMSSIKDLDPESESFDLSYLLSYIKYHNMWEEDDFSIINNTSDQKCPYMGFFMRKSLSIKPKTQKAKVFDTEYFAELDPYSEESLYEFFDYAEEKGLNVLYVNTPNHMTKEEIGRTNTICKILEERGEQFINYCLTDESGGFLLIPELDHVDDFYNRNHVNYYGAEKFTAVFAEYLNEHFDFEDHRTDEAVKEHWDGVYDLIKETIKGWEEAAAAKAAAK
ncbi:MAG: hypothetical protein IJN60_04645 [Oscillospiraceae bacterium]|nr:hypothetical protein [Oscillospiraceae bacterium]